MRTVSNNTESKNIVEEGRLVETFDEVLGISEYCLELIYDPLKRTEWLEPFVCFPEEFVDESIKLNSFGKLSPSSFKTNHKFYLIVDSGSYG